MRHPELNRADNKFIDLIIEGHQKYFRPNGYEIIKDEYFEIKVITENEPFIAQDKIY